MSPNEPPKQPLTPTVEAIKSLRQRRLEAAVTPKGSGGGWREHFASQPSQFPLQSCDFKKWLRPDSLPIERACFVLLGFEPPPLHVLRLQQNSYNLARQPTWDEPPEYSDTCRALSLSIELGNISARRVLDYPYETQHVAWRDLIRWARTKGYTIPAELETLVAKMEPASAGVSVTVTAPVVVTGTPTPAVPNWKMRIQTEATELYLRLQRSGANPTRHSIIKPMATWCHDNKVKTDGDIFPSEGYLRTHVLGGKHWDIPH